MVHLVCIMHLLGNQSIVISSHCVSVTYDLFCCTQERFSAKEPPEYYLNKMRVFLDPAGNRTARVNFFRSLRCILDDLRTGDF